MPKGSIAKRERTCLALNATATMYDECPKCSERRGEDVGELPARKVKEWATMGECERQGQEPTLRQVATAPRPWRRGVAAAHDREAIP
jgi:hypothetical protein